MFFYKMYLNVKIIHRYLTGFGVGIFQMNYEKPYVCIVEVLYYLFCQYVVLTGCSLCEMFGTLLFFTRSRGNK
jgi:hypothetical protein